VWKERCARLSQKMADAQASGALTLSFLAALRVPLLWLHQVIWFVSLGCGKLAVPERGQR
jgi:hypothetical protein